jgi:hypothetical protein
MMKGTRGVRMYAPECMRVAGSGGFDLLHRVG